MGAFRPTNYSKKELAGLSPAKRKTLQKAIVRHLNPTRGFARSSGKRRNPSTAN